MKTKCWLIPKIFLKYYKVHWNDKQSKKAVFNIWINRRKMILNVFMMIQKNTENTSISVCICFLILGFDIDICMFPVKKYDIDIWRIKRYFTVPKCRHTEHWLDVIKVRIFWEGHTILRNLPLTFVYSTYRQM